MLGWRPYGGWTRKEIRENILASQVQIKQVPPDWSWEAVDFTNKLLKRKTRDRLGHNGPEEVKGHPWLKHIDFEAFCSFKIHPVFKPEDEENFDSKALNDDWNDEGSDKLKENELLLWRKSV